MFVFLIKHFNSILVMSLKLKMFHGLRIYDNLFGSFDEVTFDEVTSNETNSILMCFLADIWILLMT